MYWLTTDKFDATGSEPKPLEFAASVKSAVKDAFDPSRMERFFLTLESDAKKLNTSIGNGLEANAKNIQNIMYNVYQEGLKYGFAFDDAKDYMEAISSSSQRMMSFTSKNVENAVMLGKALGVGAKEVGAMYNNFIQAGMSQEAANTRLRQITQDARKYGVDAGTLTKTVSDNIYKAQLYGFKGGVDGLTKMAIQAQRVGTNMDLAAKAASLAFDPEGAIEMASSLQMLGGSFGGLTDVYSLMNMAQSDMGGLQDQIMKSSASMVDFNRKTGEFKISPEMRRNMTEFAKSIGSDYETVAKTAVKFRKEQEVMSRIPLTAGMSEEDRSVIASMAEIGPGGTIQIKDPNSDKMLDFSQLSTAQVTNLIKEQTGLTKEMAQDPKKIAIDTKEIANQQLTVLQKVDATLLGIKNAGIFSTGKEKGMEIPKTIEENLVIKAEKFAKELQDKMTDAKIGDAVVKAYTTTVETLTKVIEKTTQEIGDMVDDLRDALKKSAKTEIEATSKKLNTDGITEDKDNNPATPNDFILPSGSNTMITADFGGMLKKIVPNNNDTLLGMPKESMDSLFKYANLGGEASTMIPKEKNFDKNVQTLSQYVEQKIVTENTSNVKLGIDPISVNVKLEGTGLNRDELTKLVDTNEISNAVIERLRGIFDETKLINSIPQLKL